MTMLLAYMKSDMIVLKAFLSWAHKNLLRIWGACPYWSQKVRVALIDRSFNTDEEGQYT